MSDIDCAKIKKLRIAKGLSQAAAAEQAGVGSRQAWNNIEGGREPNMTLDRLNRIAAVLGTTAKNLLK